MKKDTTIAVTGTVAAISLVGLAYLGIKVHRLEGVMDRTAQVMADGIAVNVPQCVTEAAIKKAADQLAHSVASDATDAIRNDLKSEIKIRVNDAIKSEMSAIKVDVLKAVSNKVADLDIDDIKDEVTEKIVDRCEQKFADTMNGFVDGYKEKLAWALRLVEPTPIQVGKAGSKIELHF